MSYNKRIQKYVEEFRREIGDGALNPYDIADWLLEKGEWQPSPKDVRSILARDIGQAMRTQYLEDGNGRKVRRKHCVRKRFVQPDGSSKQLSLWRDIDTAPPNFMHESFQGRRNNIANECWQLTKDVDYFNSNLNKGEPIQIMLDFRDDMDERRTTPDSPFDPEEE